LKLEEERRVAALKAARDKEIADSIARVKQLKLEEEKRVAALKAARDKEIADSIARVKQLKLEEEKRIALLKAIREKEIADSLALIAKLKLEEEKRLAALKLTLSPATLEFNITGGRSTVTVNTNAYSWDVSEVPSWCTFEKSGNSFLLNCEPNFSTNKREGFITVRAEIKSEKILVKQKEKIFLDLSDAMIEYDVTGGSKNITINTNASSWDVANLPSWCSIRKVDYLLVLSCIPNPNVEIRRATLTVTAGDQTKKIDVAQKGITFLEKGNWKQAVNKTMLNVTKHYPNGIYKGVIANGTRNGLGVYYFISDLQSFWGDFLGGESNGKGIYLIGKEGNFFFIGCPECKYYAGNWANDVKNGIGKCYDKTGKMIYHGYYNNERPTDSYPQSHDDTYKFECIESNNGDMYLGETYQGIKQGLGIFFWANGDAWYGEWKNGDRNGNGIELHYDGTVKAGRWANNAYLED
jgi:hypothetical protein